MKMVGNQGPCETLGPGLGDQLAEACDEMLAVLIVPEYLAALDPPGDDVMHRAGRIYSGLSGHAD
jgi:hypothetical protein